MEPPPARKIIAMNLVSDYEYSYGPINDWEYKLLSFSLGTALFWAISVVLICAQILQMLQKFQEYGTNGPKNT